MSLPKPPLEGGCRCGAVQFCVTAAPLLECACHCRGCQRMSSSAFSLTAIYDASSLRITKGEPVIGGLRDAALQHACCGDCMTWMYTRPAMLPDVVNVRPTLLEDHAWFTPFMETYTSTRLPWATTGAVRSFERFPPMETFGALLQEYRGWRDARSA